MNWQQLDTLTYQNRLRHLSSVHKMFLGLILFVLVIAGHPLVQVIVFFWMGLWVVGYARIPVRHYLLFLLLPFAFFTAGLPALLVDVSSVQEIDQTKGIIASWQAGSYLFSVSTAALQQVLALFCRTLASLSVFAFILFTVPFSEILQVMRWARVPALVIDLLMVMYRFIFVLLKLSAQLWVAQRARGGHQGFRAQIRDMGQLAAQLFVRAMRYYELLYQGMTARGMSEHFQVQGIATQTRSRRYEWESVLGCLALILVELWIGGLRW
jgi:cobalt/nickel transport system permease protein